MGRMTIEEAIENLTTIRNKLCSQKYETESTLTFDRAIETLRRYQKIAEIMEDNLNDIHPLDRQPYRLSKIHEILLEERKWNT